ncbi:MAG: hypothetical protein AB7S70_14440 [Hyphomicrobium sp.]
MNPTLLRRAAALALAVHGLAACSASGPPASAPPIATAAPASGDGVRRNPVVAGRRARVFVMAGFGDTCESQPAPTITITQQPAKGSVTFEPGQETTVNSSASGTCIGARVSGTGIYYTARPGETGTDTFAVEASLGDAVTQRAFTVEITE